jgi:hypothetical protein
VADADDYEVSEDEETGEGFFTPGMRPGRFQAKVIVAAKAEFGLLRRTEANRLMVRKYMRDRMRDHGMRPSHVNQHLDVSVAIFFVPSKHDLMAHQLGASRVVAERDNALHTSWTSFWGDFGKMLGFSWS